jgi:alanine racemase
VNSLKTEHSGSTANINTALIRSNLDFLKEKSGKQKVIAVVKADAYGHGAVPISRLIENDVDQFAVATVDEGIQLREAGISIPILVFTIPDINQPVVYKHYNLTATISDFRHFEFLEDGTRYQLNFDTGMKRIGFYPGQVEEVINSMQKYRKLKCTGIYSHYATADDPGSEFVQSQLKIFRDIRSRFPDTLPAHMSNTSAVLHYDLDHFDMIRPGLGLFGYAAGKVQSENLKPALRWETKAVLVREIKKGVPVSYGGTWTAPADGFIATLPAGYGDGIPRALGNRLRVCIEGELFPVVGSVTMDHCMVFLGNQTIEAGTRVELMGNQSWLANTWAEKAGTITHEILCRLTPRVHRTYD